MNILETMFGRTKTPAERLRQHQRAIQKAQRELDRERTKLEAQQKTLVNDIKKAARDGQISVCKIKARDLVRTRRYIEKFYGMRTQLQAVSLRLQTMSTNQAMAQSMKGATKAMSMMSRQMNIPAMQRILMEFEKESSMMDMKEEMMSDAVDDVMDDVGEGETEEEEGDKILKEVLDEIGISVGQQLETAPTTTGPTSVAESRQAVAIGEPSGGPADIGSPPSNGAAGGNGGGPPLDDFQARLDALRRD